MEKIKDKKTDEDLVEMAQNGDKKATEELLCRHAELVRGCARRFFLVGGEMEDLIQEGLIGLYNAIEDYKKKEDGRSFKNFAYLCVSRRIIDAVKAAARKKNAPLNYSVSAVDAPEWAYMGLNPEDMLISSDDQRELRQKMSKALSDFEYKVMSMYMDGMGYAEICDATGKSEKSVENAIQRSKKKLQQILKKK